MIETKLFSYTQPAIGVGLASPEELIAYAARVSSEKDESSRGENYEGLLKYCIRNKHWSVFEMADATVEIIAPRDISRQLLRHRSFSFQEFSQRYSDQIEFTTREIRRQDKKNRQNSHDDIPEYLQEEFKEWTDRLLHRVNDFYKRMRDRDVAKETARVILPEGLTLSRLYMKGSLRSWLHYLEVRDDEGVTQKEHVELARKIKEELEPVFPVVMGLT